MLVQNDLVQVKTQAANTNDWSELSDANTDGAIIQVIPFQMATPTRGSLTNINQLHIEWIELIGDDTGSATIESYNLQLDDGTNPWLDILGDGVTYPYQTGTSVIIVDSIIPGHSYQIRVRAYNAHGWSAWSEELTIKASDVPDKPAAPTTNINNHNILVLWADPFDGYDDIDAYSIVFRRKDNLYEEITAYCDGSNSVLFNKKSCDVPVSALKQSPINLVAGDEVKVKIRAHNINGWSEYSDPTVSGGLIEVTPSQMSAPTRDDLTTTLRLVVNWVALSEP